MEENNKKKRFINFLIVLFILTVFSFLAAFLFGSSRVSFKELILIFNNTAPKSTHIIFFNIRLPRALLSYIAGGALAISGACLQGIFRNPMADSYVLGVSSGAALGATIAIAFGVDIAFLGFSSVTILAFIFASFVIIAVYRISKINGTMSTFTLLLSGIAISSLCSAFMYAIMVASRDKMENIIMWSMGSFTTATWDKLYVGAPVMIIASALCLIYARDLNIMLQGDEAARHLGVNPNSTRRNLIILTTIASSAAIAISGIIGFVGLIIPHVVRLIIGPDHRKLLVASFFSGSVFLLISDTISRVLIYKHEIPVGVITAFIGVPFFLYLLRNGRKTA
ncbi:MAG: iron ABC transporter permease [Clostridia bacterium]|nr:iron ABC transporter permease [Clostridia bacterium]